MNLIDTHCHLDITEFAPAFQQILANARAAGVAKMILPGVDRAGWARLLLFCQQEHGLFAAPGLHPLYLSHHVPEDLAELDKVAATGTIVAIGEIGLDYYVTSLDRSLQQWYFEQQLSIAAAHRLPVLLHIRKAHDQVLATLRRRRFPYGGIVHAFNGSHQQACQFINLGFAISICGTITYDRARKIRQIARDLPLDSLVLETDAPDIPLAAHRGKSNLPEYLPEVLAALGALRPELVEQLARSTTMTATRILGLHDH